MPGALASVVRSVDCGLLVLSYNDESWLHVEELEELCAAAPRPRNGRRGGNPGRRREVATLAFDSARYVGARIGIYDPSGRKVGRVGHLSNRELLVIAGEPVMVRRVIEAVRSMGSVGSAGIAPPMADRLQQAT
jgi:adenine-specific DNA-methyltransferase